MKEDVQREQENQREKNKMEIERDTERESIDRNELALERNIT